MQNKWGLNCRQNCLCKNGGQCDAVTGACRCLPGVRGIYCEDGCPPGRYGTRCQHKCLVSCIHGFCHRRYGFCVCPVGKFGPHCEMNCPKNSWGTNCQNICSCRSKHADGCDPQVRTDAKTATFNVGCAVANFFNAICKARLKYRRIRLLLLTQNVHFWMNFKR